MPSTSRFSESSGDTDESFKTEDSDQEDACNSDYTDDDNSCSSNDERTDATDLKDASNPRETQYPDGLFTC